MAAIQLSSGVFAHSKSPLTLTGSVARLPAAFSLRDDVLQAAQALLTGLVLAAAVQIAPHERQRAEAVIRRFEEEKR